MPKDLGAQHRRTDARAIFDAAVRSADPGSCVAGALSLEHSPILTLFDQTYDLDSFDSIIVIGAGKATPAMALAVEQILGDRITAGFINTKYGHSLPLNRIRITESGHPIPDEAGVAGTGHMLRLLEKANAGTLVLCLFSGGGSAIMPAPVEGLSLEEKQRATQLLLECGATIDEINTIRKHLSLVKGGHLARLAGNATVVSLMISDVIGDRLDTIASGPTFPDPTTFNDCLKLLGRYGLTERMPGTIRAHLKAGAEGSVADTPAAGDSCFSRAQNVVVGNATIAIEAARREALQRGYEPLVLSSRIAGETRDVAAVHCAIAQEVVTSAHPVSPPACIISGGETTVTISGPGKGGRNQEFGLAAAIQLEGWPGITALSGGTDGTDGPTDAAGAIADSDTVARGKELKMAATDYLEANDSYHFFAPLDDLVITGPTGTNVMDLRLFLVGEPAASLSS